MDWIKALGLLKVMQRSGWLSIGELFGDSVASHSFRVAVISFYIASKEGEDPYKAAVGGLIHDIHECFIGDLTPKMKRFVKADAVSAARHFFKDFNEDLFKLWKELYEGSSSLSIIVKDSDRIELIAQSLEYGFRNKAALSFAEKAKKELRLRTSKEIVDRLYGCYSSI